MCASAAQPGTTTPRMPRARPLTVSFPSPPDYISRQPSRVSRPPSRDTSRTGRQVGEPVGFPLAAAAAPRSDSPASPAAPAAGAASPTRLGLRAAGPGAQGPGRDTRSPPSPPAGATPLGSALVLRGRRSPQPRAAPRPGALIPAPALPQPPPPTLNMDSDSCAAAFHPEVSESCSGIAPDHPHTGPALPGAGPPPPARRPPLPQLSVVAPPPAPNPAPHWGPRRTPRRPSPRRPSRGHEHGPLPGLGRLRSCLRPRPLPASLAPSPPPGIRSERRRPVLPLLGESPRPPTRGTRCPLGRGLRSWRPRLLP